MENWHDPEDIGTTLSTFEKCCILYFCATNLCSYKEHAHEYEQLIALQEKNDEDTTDLKKFQLRAYRRRGHSAVFVGVTLSASAITLLQYLVA